MGILFKQLKSLLFSFIIIFAFSGIVLGTVLYFHHSEGIALNYLTNDPAVIAGLPIYIGVLSQFGIFFWAAAAAICLFSSFLIKNKQHKAFIIASALISMLLGFDDVFMFHESVFPSIGIHQKIVFLSYGILMLVYGLKFFNVLLRTDYLLFVFSIFWFGISMLVDNFIHSSSPYITKLLEDGAKFIGIISWVFYFAATCKQILVSENLKST